MAFRTDRNNNPVAFTTDIAKQAGLILGTDYAQGDPFTADGATYYTAKLLGDPLKLTITVIDKITFYNKTGRQRWIYIGIPPFIWKKLDLSDRIEIVYFMYRHEGGIELDHLFA